MQSLMVCGPFASSGIKHVEYVLPSIGPQSATGSPTAPTGTATGKSNLSTNGHLLRNTPSPTQFESPQPISPSNFSGDHHTHHNIKLLEQLLDSSLATVAVIQISGNTLADVLTPRAYDTFKALYALAALDAAASSTTSRGEIPNRSTFTDISMDCPHSSNNLLPFPNSSLAVPRTGRIHVSISVELFSWAGLAAVSFLVVFFNLPRLC